MNLKHKIVRWSMLAYIWWLYKSELVDLQRVIDYILGLTQPCNGADADDMYKQCLTMLNVEKEE